jgi:hypothetical protein
VTVLIAKTQGKEPKLIQIIKQAESVQFSPERGWLFICRDFERAQHMRMDYKWIRATDIRFQWIRKFNFGE